MCVYLIRNAGRYSTSPIMSQFHATLMLNPSTPSPPTVVIYIGSTGVELAIVIAMEGNIEDPVIDIIIVYVSNI